MNNNTKITIYGKPSSTYEYMKMMIKDTASNAGISISINEIQNTQKFVDEHIDQIPAVKINDTLVSRDNGDLNAYIHKANQIILKNENFGELKRIIVPIDFSDNSESALSFAYRFASHLKSVINLVHVYRPNYDEVILQSRSQKISKWDERLNSYKEELNNNRIPIKSNGTLVTTDTIAGFPTEVILEQSDNIDNSIIIMGTTGVTSTMDRVMGSVSTFIAQNSQAPVLLVPQGSNFKSLDKILYCSMDPILDRYVVEKLAKLASSFDSEIHIIHIDDKTDSKVEIMDEIWNLWKLHYPKNKLKMEVFYKDDVAEAINEYATDNDIQLISLCRTENRFFKNLFKSGMTNKLMRKSDLPILVLNKNEK